jgi:diguanylate cyclase (GGDEF)-like protein
VVRGRRMSDLEMMAVFLTWPVMVAVSFVGLQKPGSPLAGEWSVLVSAIIVALLVRRRRSVVLMTVVVIACVTWIVWSRLGATGLAPVTITLEVTVVTSVIFAFRAVRDVAVQSLARLSLGEVTDPLTGLANRRGLERYAPNLWQELARESQSVAVIVVDIDHFKRINDTRGHAAGDVVLQQVAELMSASLRHKDIAVRLGGEEFLVLASTPPGQAPWIAERLRALIQDTLHTVTVSIGVHEAAPNIADALPTTLWSAVNVADRALYAAKHTGRNRVVSTHHARV